MSGPMPNQCGYRYRRLTHAQERAIARSLAMGVAASDLMAAYDVSRRTIFRARERAGAEDVRVVRVDGWTATFAIGPEGPVRTSPWRYDLGDKSLPAHARASENQGATPLISEAHP